MLVFMVVVVVGGGGGVYRGGGVSKRFRRVDFGVWLVGFLSVGC